MDKIEEKNFTVIEGAKTDELSQKHLTKSRQTNPIAKKLVEFHNENLKKFTVKDLFKP